MSTKSRVLCRLYRSLLKTAQPFTSSINSHGAILPSSMFSGNVVSPVTLTCLLHRIGSDDEMMDERMHEYRDMMTNDEKENVLFSSLLREVVAGGGSYHASSDEMGTRHMQFPHHVDTHRLRAILQREFRIAPDKSKYDVATRTSVAFRTLRELNKKLALASSQLLERSSRSRTRHPQQAARNVQPLLSRGLVKTSSFLRPGVFLLAHPNMTGYFRRSVICILDHVDPNPKPVDKENESEQGATGRGASYGTYGLIVNRVSVSNKTGKILTLEDVLRPLPAELTDTFGSSPVKEGGPVHMALQMLYQQTSLQQEEAKIGGTLLTAPTVLDDENDLAKSTAFETDKAVYFRGDVLIAANAVSKGSLDREDVSFFVGASCWSAGQLETEIDLGFWLPCTGPPVMAQTGICDHDGYDSTMSYGDRQRPEADLWLSMMSACGEEEAQLAHLLFRDNGHDANGVACDEF